MSTEAKQDEIIEVKEEVDGSAVVDLPDSIPNPDKKEDEGVEEVEAAAGGEIEEHDHPDDTEAVRAARRERRKAKKQLVRQTNAEKDLRLQMLDRQNREMAQRLAILEGKTHSSELARIDKAIEDAELRVNYARLKLSEAAQAQDGNAMAKAQELWLESRQQAEALKHLKTQSAKPQQNASIPDPRLQRNAAQWMERNSWYDPNGRDLDSKIAKQVDEQLTSEGWDPTSEEYWEELDNRLQKYLPTRYNETTDESSYRRSKPRGIVTGSGRESAARAGGKNTFTLSPEQVRAMKDSGMWEDPEKRNKMIRRYAEYARQNQGYKS
jgi:hypothetical protein